MSYGSSVTGGSCEVNVGQSMVLLSPQVNLGATLRVFSKCIDVKEAKGQDGRCGGVPGPTVARLLTMNRRSEMTS